MSEIKTITKIRNEGFAALVKALGPGDAIQYINSFEQGTGDYTTEKCCTPDENFDTVVTRIKKKNGLL